MLERNDFEAAKGPFYQLLEAGGTPLQQRIAERRLRESQEQTGGLFHPTPTKARARRKTAAKKSEETQALSHFVGLPNRSIVEIRKH